MQLVLWKWSQRKYRLQLADDAVKVVETAGSEDKSLVAKPPIAIVGPMCPTD